MAFAHNPIVYTNAFAKVPDYKEAIHHSRIYTKYQEADPEAWYYDIASDYNVVYYR